MMPFIALASVLDAAGAASASLDSTLAVNQVAWAGEVEE